jgi:biopolymer transport protein ExbB
VSDIVVEAIGARTLDPKLIEQRLQEKALVETPKLMKRLSVLDTIITISPLLGLLGTVTGMIRAFHVVGDPSTMNGPAAITGGVAEALIATATGLAIAIVTLVGYNFLGEKVKTLVSTMEIAATQTVNVFSARSALTAPPPIPTAPPIPSHEVSQTRA